MKVVILGSTGMLGGALYETLSGAHETIGIARRAGPYTDYVCDLLSHALWPCLDMVKADVIINTAAITNLATCHQHIDQAYRLHVQLPQQLSKRSEKLIHISTDSVFDGVAPPPLGYDELFPPAPLNVYALTKLFGEDPILEAGGLVIRTNIYGFNRHQPGRSIFEWAMSSLRNEEPMVGYQDVVFNPVNIWQLSRSLEFCLQLGITGLINLAADTPISKADFLAAIIRINQAEFSLLGFQNAPSSEIVRPKQTVLDTRRSHQLGLPTLKLDDGIFEVSALYNEYFGI